jgi:hypothetical protein
MSEELTEITEKEFKDEFRKIEEKWIDAWIGNDRHRGDQMLQRIIKEKGMKLQYDPSVVDMHYYKGDDESLYYGVRYDESS